jgi:hypothetical protein
VSSASSDVQLPIVASALARFSAPLLCAAALTRGACHTLPCHCAFNVRAALPMMQIVRSALFMLFVL